MFKLTEQQNLITNKDQLLEIFYSGINKEQRLGLELEKLPVYKDSLEAVSYEDIKNVLDSFNPEIWTRYYENGKLLGLKAPFGHITLEPGSQVEISLKPLTTVDEIQKFVENYLLELKLAADRHGVRFLNIGSQPKTTYEKIKIIPKKRYDLMSEYLPTKGALPLVMMRETAGIQVSVDYESENDAIEKMSLALKLSPIMSAVFANSPFRSGKINGYKSFRANAWLDTDDDRCGLVSKKLIETPERFSFENYMETLLEVPMIFIEREGEALPLKLKFKDFLQNGYQGYRPTIEDWNLHLSLYFPDVRLKNYVEIRNHDSQTDGLIFAVPAFWKGIIYNKEAINKAKTLVSFFSFEDFQEIRRESPKEGLSYKIKGKSLQTIAKELLEISFVGLESFSLGEEKYLSQIIKLVNEGQVPADNVIEFNLI